MRIHRMISILQLIESKGMIKAQEIATRLEISLRTVYRDIDSLCEAGLPLAAKPGPHGGIYLMEGYAGGKGHLQEEDIISLYINSIGIIPEKQSDMAMKLNNTIAKLQNNFSPNLISELNKIKKRFYFDDALWWEENKRVKDIDILIYAVLHAKGLEITYAKYNGATSIRSVQPYGIVVKRMDWYMIGYCTKNKAIRSFKCERIQDSKLLDESFEVPDNFNIHEYWTKAKGSFKTSNIQEELYPVVIKLNKNNSNILVQQEVLETNLYEDHIIATINMYGFSFAVNDAMKLIRFAEIIEPIELRSFIENELNRISLMYQSGQQSPDHTDASES